MLAAPLPRLKYLTRVTRCFLPDPHSAPTPPNIAKLYTTGMPSSDPAALPLAPRKAEEDVWTYPRPPLLQRVPNKLQVIWFHPPSPSSGAAVSSSPSSSSSPGGDGRKQTIIAETTEGMRVCETSHPPTYYLPPSSLILNSTSAAADDAGRNAKVKLEKNSKRSFCEWKGQATYYTLTVQGEAEVGAEGNGEGKVEKVENRIWSYDTPTAGFKPLKGYLSFYASSNAAAGRSRSSGMHNGDREKGEWRCFVDGEEVGIQEG